MTQEVWKDIQGCRGNYVVSNQGRVYCHKSYVTLGGKRYLKKPHLLKDANNGNGYRYVTISIKKVRKNHYVHVLVASAFLKRENNKQEVNHKNGNKSDNRVENLEWVSKSENLNHAIRTGLKRIGGDVSNAIKVRDLTTGEVYPCISHAAKARGYNYGTLKDGLKRGTYKELVKIIEFDPKAAKENGYSESRLKITE